MHPVDETLEHRRKDPHTGKTLISRENNALFLADIIARKNHITKPRLNMMGATSKAELKAANLLKYK